jgi:hypothetical protein
VTGARLLLKRCDHPQVGGKSLCDALENVKSGSADTIIIRKKYPHALAYGRRAACTQPKRLRHFGHI